MGVVARKAGRALLACVLALAMAPTVPAAAFAESGPTGPSGLVAQSPSAITAAEPADYDAAVWDGSIDTSWYDKAAAQFTLTKPAQLAGLAAIVNGTAAGIDRDDFTGKTVALGADMQLNATAATGVDSSQQHWTSIGAPELVGVGDGVEGLMPSYDDHIFFNGTFDGAGHVVKNIYCYDNTTGTYGGYQGFFGNLGQNAVVRDMGLEGGYVYGRVAGGIAAISHTSPDASQVPTIVGCYNTATIVGDGSTTRGVGGIFGGEEQWRGSDANKGGVNYHGGAYIANCYNTGRIAATTAGGTPIGGIAGTGSVQIYACYNTGAIDSESVYAGGIAGNLMGAGAVLGNGTQGAPEGASVVRNSYALTGTVTADENGNVKLFNLFDGVNKKGGTTEAAAAVTEGNTIGFVDLAWLAKDAYEDDALSGSYELADGGGVQPVVLYWQKSLSQQTLASIGPRVYPIEAQRYTGKPIEPGVVIAGTADGSPWFLNEGSDYKVTYENNVEAGTVTAKVTGFGRYTGELAPISFQIIQSDLTQCVIQPIEAQWYYGGTVTPDIVVKTAGGDTLSEDLDYEVEFTGNDKPGQATVEVTAKGSSATGSTSAQFWIIDVPVAHDAQGNPANNLPGSGTEADPYLLDSKTDLQFVAYKTHATDSDAQALAKAHYKLAADIDAASSDPAFLIDRPADPLFEGVGFSGVLDGDGKTVNLGLTEEGVSFGMYDVLSFIVATDSQAASATMKNLNLTGSVYCPDGAGSALLSAANTPSTIIENCTSSVAVTGQGWYMGGAGGMVNTSSSGCNLTIRDCKNTGAIVAGTGAGGGIIAELRGGTNIIENCENTGTVNVSGGPGGGIVGSLAKPFDTTAFKQSNTVISKTHNTGDVRATGSAGSAGGIIGYNQGEVKALSIDRCYNTGSVTGYDQGVGGIVGKLFNNATITNCYNTGAVATPSSYPSGGGIVGYFTNAPGNAGQLEIRNVYNAGAIGSNRYNSPGGGVIGFVSLHSTVFIASAYFDGASATVGIGDSFDADSIVITGDGTLVDADVMKSADFPALLGTAFSRDADNRNGGYPVLEDRASGKRIDACTVDEIADWAYTGAPVKPSVKVTAPDGAALTEGGDYVVFVSVSGTQGMATVWGIGDWEGYQDKSFTVVPCSLEHCSLSSFNSMSYLDFAGGEAAQQVVITNPAGKAMVEGEDYEVVYAGNDAVGTARVLIRGLAPYYTGTAYRMFTVLPGNIANLPLTGLEDHYAWSQGSSGLFVYEHLTAPNGYTLQRADYGTGDYTRVFKDASGAVVKTSGGSNAYSLTKAGVYTVELTGCGNWVGTQESKPFSYGYDMATDVTVGGIDAVYPFTNDDLELKPVLTYEGLMGETELEPGAEYTVTYLDASGNEADAVRNAGVYTAVFAPTADNNSWYGTKSVSFSIASPDFYIGADDVKLASTSLAYTGSALAPQVTVTVAGHVLRAGSNYTLTYLDASGKQVSAPVEKGSYQVVVTGRGNYSGRVVKDFTVEGPYFRVYVQKGESGTPQLVKEYTQTSFEALRSDASTPVSGMYCMGSGTVWNVVSTSSYVTLEDLLDDAGVSYSDDTASVAIAGSDGKASAVTLSTLNAQNRFYSDVEPYGGASAASPAAAPVVFALTSRSGLVETTTGDREAYNIEHQSTDDSPRLVYGIDASQLAHQSPARGERYLKNVAQVTVIVPADSSPDTPAPGPSQDTTPSSTIWSRLYGQTAPDTMSEVVKTGFDSADTVVIATIDGYEDALAASALAGKVGGPVLLTAPDSLSAQTRAEIQRLGASKAYIVGGMAAVSAAVEGQVRSALAGSASVVRLGGQNAPHTAEIIASEVGSARSDTCIISTLSSFCDALSVSPYAYAKKAPIYLTDGSNQIGSSTLAAIRAAGYKHAVIVGGPAAVASSAEAALAAAGVGDVRRLYGATAYETSAEITKWVLDQGLSADGLGIATAQSYYDALCGAALCGENGSALLLVDDWNRSTLDVVKAHKSEMGTAYVFGGPAAVSEDTWSACLLATRR